MAFRPLTDTIQVSEQISIADIDAAASQGIRLIINNRPDGEEPGQPLNETLQSAAADRGISWLYLPVYPGGLGMPEVEQMKAALANAEGKILAFCRSGTRSTNLWSLATAANGAMAPDDIVATAASAGYDVSGIRQALVALYGA